MAAIVQTVIDGYDYLFDELADPVTKNWFLAGSPYKIACILICYVYFSTRLGPWYMRNRKPYKLKNVIKIYNIFQIVVNIYMFYQGFFHILSDKFNFVCQSVDDTRTPDGEWIASHVWLYYITKLTDLLDTVFFVLRKSNRQITSLHLHHHTLMPFATWIGVMYLPGGQGIILGCCNSFVHAIMYTYYYIAGLGEEYKKYLWWKRHVTELQLVQFVVIGVHSANSLFYECGFPTVIKIMLITYAGIFINMFGKFYYYAYIVKKNEDKGKDAINKSAGDNCKNGKEATADKSNGIKNEMKANGDTVKNIHRNEKCLETKSKINSRIERHTKTQ